MHTCRLRQHNVLRYQHCVLSAFVCLCFFSCGAESLRPNRFGSAVANPDNIRLMIVSGVSNVARLVIGPGTAPFCQTNWAAHLPTVTGSLAAPRCVRRRRRTCRQGSRSPAWRGQVLHIGRPTTSFSNRNRSLAAPRCVRRLSATRPAWQTRQDPSAGWIPTYISEHSAVPLLNSWQRLQGTVP